VTEAWLLRCIDRISRLQDGQLVTIAGKESNSSSTGDGGDAKAATLRTTWAMTQDAAGSAYFVDAISVKPNYNYVIRKLTCTGVAAVAPSKSLLCLPFVLFLDEPVT
jgi:hypothetical protein